MGSSGGEALCVHSVLTCSAHFPGLGVFFFKAPGTGVSRDRTKAWERPRIGCLAAGVPVVVTDGFLPSQRTWSTTLSLGRSLTLTSAAISPSSPAFTTWQIPSWKFGTRRIWSSPEPRCRRFTVQARSECQRQPGDRSSWSVALSSLQNLRGKQVW